jgi:hypothetical protein
MQRTETVVDPVCSQCHFSNELGCELADDPRCMKCGASLEHDVIVSYNDNCPLCGVSYEVGQPYVFFVDASSVKRWICRDCEGSPRGTFYQMFEQAKEKPVAAPPCCLCGNSSTLVALTHANPDGEFLCEACSTSDTGKQMIEEHYADER